jgi:GWxTD domain-containing protein
MKFRLGLTAAFLCLTASVFAADIGPLQFLLTQQEAAAWKNVKTDEEARAFLDLFWARRDPSAGTPQNEFRELIEARIKYADEQFAEVKTRGAMTDRGKAFILYGKPSRATRAADTAGTPGDPSRDAGSGAQNGTIVEWTYEGDDAKAIFGQPRVVLRFIDRMASKQFRLERGRDMNRAQQNAIERSITQPNATAAPAAAAAAPAQVQIAIPATPAAPAPPPIVTELTTDAYKTAIGEGKDRSGAFTWGEYVTGFGETFVPVGVYIPKSAGLTGPDVTLFGVVRDASGKNVLAIEEKATATETRGDWFVDHSLRLPAGKYHGTFGVAQNGKVVAVASSAMEVAGTLDKDATGISPLILSNNVYPLTQPQQATDPFAFGGLRVIPKADRTFRTGDEFWYFVELRNPGVETPALPEGQVQVAPAPAATPMPKVQIKIDVVGTDATGKTVKRPAPLREVDAIELKGVPGHFAIGNAFPPNTFKPGDYTFTMKVIDTIKKTSYTLSDKFKVVE